MSLLLWTTSMVWLVLLIVFVLCYVHSLFVKGWWPFAMIDRCEMSKRLPKMLTKEISAPCETKKALLHVTYFS